MCNPLLVAGAVMSAGSMAAKMSAANKVQGARTRATDAESVRQRAFDSEATAVNDKSRDRYSGFGDKQTEKAGALSDYFKSNSSSVNDIASEPALPTSASNVVVAEQARKMDGARAFGDQQSTALGNLRAFGDLLGGISRDQAIDAAQVGQIGSFKQGSSNVLPLELMAANNKGSGLRLFGDILGVGGMAASMGGAAGLGPSFASLFGSSPYGAMGATGGLIPSSGGVGGLGNGFAIGGV